MAGKQMNDEEYRECIEKLIKSGRAWDAMYELQDYAMNYINNMEMAIRKGRAERNTVIKICDSKESNKQKVETIRTLMG